MVILCAIVIKYRNTKCDDLKEVNALILMTNRGKRWTIVFNARDRSCLV